MKTLQRPESIRLIQLQYNNIEDCFTDFSMDSVVKEIEFIDRNCTKGSEDGTDYWYEFEEPTPTEKPVIPTLPPNTTATEMDGWSDNESTTLEPWEMTTMELNESSSTSSVIISDSSSSLCNHVMMENIESESDLYWTAVEDECYQNDLGSARYICTGEGLMVKVTWIRDTECSDDQSKQSPVSGLNTHCEATNDFGCESVVPVTQYMASENCTRLQLVEQYSLIVNQCLEYKQSDMESVFVFNRFVGERTVKQIHYRSLMECMEDEQRETQSDSVEIVHGECLNDFYYAVGTQPVTTTVKIPELDTAVDDAPFYRDAYQSIFGPEGPTTIEVDIVLLAVIIIAGCA